MRRLREALFAGAADLPATEETPAILARVDAAFRDLVGRDPIQLMFQLQSHAAAGDPEIRDVVRQRLMAMVDEGVRVTGAPRQVVLERLAQGLLVSVAIALDLPDDYRLLPAATASLPADESAKGDRA